MSGRVTLDVAYERELGGEGPEAYVRLLDDALSGDQRLFARQDNVEAAWAVVDDVLQHHHRAIPYARGTLGARGLRRGSCRPGSSGPSPSSPRPSP